MHSLSDLLSPLQEDLIKTEDYLMSFYKTDDVNSVQLFDYSIARSGKRIVPP
jgi:hypothetical protein